MALGELSKRKIYLSINHGKVVKGSKEHKEEYSYVEGGIESIYLKDSKFGNEQVVRWYIDMRDGDELYSLCLPFSSGVFKSIILALASDEALTASTPVKIVPYEGKNGFTKVVVYSNGTKLDWITKELPTQKRIKIGNKRMKEDSEVMILISKYVEAIEKKITNKA